MPIKTYREAVKEALAQEMEHDERVVLIGEDLRGGHGGNAPEEARIEAFGGVLGVTKGLWTQFGSDRVIDTPITESAIVGMAAGAAATGLRPVAELMFMDFSVLAMMRCTTRRQSFAICLVARPRRRW
jgi:pyruvate dehydrogenase E1 component beta subunit